MTEAVIGVTRHKLLRRLQRLEGQVRGVARMIEQERDCQDILTQLAAIRGASHQISVMFVQEYARNCLVNHDPEADPQEIVARMVSVLGQLPH